MGSVYVIIRNPTRINLLFVSIDFNSTNWFLLSRYHPATEKSATSRNCPDLRQSDRTFVGRTQTKQAL